MDQLEQGKLRLPVSEQKSELIGRHRRCSVQRELLLQMDQRQPHALQQRNAKSDGVTGVLLTLMPLLALLPLFMV